MTDTAADPHLARALETIARCGHFVQSEAGQDGGPALYYTVGLTASSGHGFELALSGLEPAELVRDILNNASKALAGKTPADGMYLDGVLLDGYALRLRPVPPDVRFGWITEIYGRAAGPEGGNRPAVWQLVWPDEIGRFPGDPEYMHPAGMQALL